MVVCDQSIDCNSTTSTAVGWDGTVVASFCFLSLLFRFIGTVLTFLFVDERKSFHDHVTACHDAYGRLFSENVTTRFPLTATDGGKYGCPVHLWIFDWYG